METSKKIEIVKNTLEKYDALLSMSEEATYSSGGWGGTTTRLGKKKSIPEKEFQTKKDELNGLMAQSAVIVSGSILNGNHRASKLSSWEGIFTSTINTQPNSLRSYLIQSIAELELQNEK